MKIISVEHRAASRIKPCEPRRKNPRGVTPKLAHPLCLSSFRRSKQSLVSPTAATSAQTVTPISN